MHRLGRFFARFSHQTGISAVAIAAVIIRMPQLILTFLLPVRSLPREARQRYYSPSESTLISQAVKVIVAQVFETFFSCTDRALNKRKAPVECPTAKPIALAAARTETF